LNSASAATVSACILPTISGGVFAGTNKAYHPGTSNPGICGWRPVRGRHPERAHLAVADEGHHRRDVVEERVDATRNDVLQRRRRAAIWHMRQLDAGYSLEQFAGQMRPGAISGRGHSELSAVRLCVSDKLP